jgi:hypothetical protein
MQIKELIIYGKKGQIRRLQFNIGTVSIITGKNKSGKTAIGEIINYCLGEDGCNIADGVIRDSSSWFALLLQFENEQVFVARQNPPITQQSTDKCYIETRKNIIVPLTADFISDVNRKTLVEILSRKLGILENLHTPQENQTRRPLEANLRHALIYCFQCQYEIASPKTLFHKQQEDFVTQSIKDTLPYFLGIIDENFLALEHERAELKRQLIRENRRLEELRMIKGSGHDLAIKLYSEAKQAGLVDGNIFVDNGDYDALFNVLQDINKWLPASVTSEEADKLIPLQEELRNKEIELNAINDDIDSANRYISGATDYSSANSQQIHRLQSIGLFEQLNFEPDKCPLCSGRLGENSLPTANKIKQAITDLNTNIDTIKREKPRIQKHINDLKTKREELRNVIHNIKIQIDAEYSQREIASRIKDLNSRRARIVGRISLWLDSVHQTNNLDKEQTTISQIELRLKEIDKLLDRDTIEERKASLLRRIAVDMTEWARMLKIEHSDNPFSLDMNKVTVIADKPERPVPLQQLGGGSNWVGVHLITYFALHKYFISTNRPVPRFIFIDQPSQVNFPSEQEGKSTDWEQVKHLYKFIFDRIDELDGKLQVIIVDHADFNDQQFVNSVIEDWHGEKNLIPTEWYELNSKTEEKDSGDNSSDQ